MILHIEFKNVVIGAAMLGKCCLIKTLQIILLFL